MCGQPALVGGWRRCNWWCIRCCLLPGTGGLQPHATYMAPLLSLSHDTMPPVFDVDNDKPRAAWEMEGSTDWQADGVDATNGFSFEVCGTSGGGPEGAAVLELGRLCCCRSCPLCIHCFSERCRGRPHCRQPHRQPNPSTPQLGLLCTLGLPLTRPCLLPSLLPQGTDAGALDYALNRALDAYYNDRAWFHGLQKRVMQQVRCMVCRQGVSEVCSWESAGTVCGVS